MFNISQYKSKIILYAGLLLISFSVVYTSTLNPFTHRVMNVDTSVYMTIAQGITRGHVLYKDLADNKGPLTYFMSVPGYYIAGITGVWLTELFLIFITFLFMYKTALLFVNSKTAFLSVFAVSLAMHPFFYVNAGTEEYSLAFLMISLYIYTKHYFSGNKTHLLEILALGVCFACSVMIRLNMFPLWAGFCLVIIIESAIKKEILNILKYVAFFSLGVLIVLLPIYLWMRHFGLFNDFYYNVILGGITRGFRLSVLNDFLKNFYLVLNRSFSFIPLCVGIIWFFIKYKNISSFYYIGFIISYFLSVIFLSFASGNSHYNLVLIPFFIPVISFLSDALLQLFSKIKYKYLVLALFFCITFSEGIIRLSYYLFFNFDSGSQLRTAGKIIDDNTKPNDLMINLGWNGYIYPYTKRDYASKYIFQSEAFNHIPGANEEFVSAIMNNPPKVMTIYTANDGGGLQFRAGWHEKPYKLLETDYTLISDDYGIKIFLRNY
ncbi:MAG: hypothetical protein FWB86_10695 [Treponema sp.]|nr:hypothetical protein [Treponema sp.]